MVVKSAGPHRDFDEIKISAGTIVLADFSLTERMALSGLVRCGLAGGIDVTFIEDTGE